MKPLFPRWSDTLLRTTLLVGVVGVLGFFALLMVWVRSPYATGQFDPVQQPIYFDHRHHVRDEGIDCKYCHADAWKGAFAGVPATSLCMNCHSQVWAESPRFKPLYDSYFTGTPIRWLRVNALPDFSFFNHSAHVSHGVGCSTCHGRVDLMPAVDQQPTLLMGWCLDCHRHPANNLRPLDRITDMEWSPSDPGTQYALMKELGVESKTDCSTCHR